MYEDAQALVRRADDANTVFPLSAAERATLIEYIERLLCDMQMLIAHCNGIRNRMRSTLLYGADETELTLVDERRISELTDADLLMLVLSPLDLMVLSERINCLLPEVWQPLFAQVGKEIMDRYGLKIPERHGDHHMPPGE